MILPQNYKHIDKITVLRLDSAVLSRFGLSFVTNLKLELRFFFIGIWITCDLVNVYICT